MKLVCVVCGHVEERLVDIDAVNRQRCNRWIGMIYGSGVNYRTGALVGIPAKDITCNGCMTPQT